MTKSEQFQIYMFHFRCPVCAASPDRVLLRDYMQQWSTAPQKRLRALLCVFSGALAQIMGGQSRWITKKFAKAGARLQRAVSELPFEQIVVGNAALRVASPTTLY